MNCIQQLAIAAAFLMIWSLPVGMQELHAAPGPTPDKPQESANLYTNRLAQEKSPYLLQHAHNPVDWYPWGEEAFARARRENKPIFLSVGYSTCHWCHVMERESFEDTQIARQLNENFVCIKVDREERPDVDAVYMKFVQATTGGGGWPLNVWLTPDLQPFFGGTYFPPKKQYGMDPFPELLTKISELWRNDRERVLTQGRRFMQRLLKEDTSSAKGQSPPITRLMQSGLKEADQTFDEKQGGFGGAPKFPRPVTLNLLSRVVAREGMESSRGKRALEINLLTLRKMEAGGIHDHLGGGFHRYSVDDEWHVPHFEKMLYDQAQLAMAYLDAFQLSGDALFERTARGILDYVRRDLTSPDGGFYCAEDADSLFESGKPEHGEGAFYAWTKAEIDRELDNQQAALFNYFYDVKTKGNVPEASDRQGELKGRNVLRERQTLAASAKEFKKSTNEVEQILAQARQKLLSTRNKRPRPHLDDKILTGWNGLMISAYSRAYQVLEDNAYLSLATQAASFLRRCLYDEPSQELLRAYRKGPGSIKGFADDYAFLIQGLLDLYEAGFDVQWLKWAVDLQQKQDKLFWDDTDGCYFNTKGGDANLLVRLKSEYDGAEPAANSVSALNLLRLSQMTGLTEWRQQADRVLGRFAAQLEEQPLSMPQLLVAADFSSSGPRQIVLAGEPESKLMKELLREVHRRYLPNKILLLADGAEGQRFLGQNLEFMRSVKMQDGKPMAYVCQNFVCQLPTNDPKTVARLLK